MGVPSIYPYPPHLNLFGVWNLLKFNDFFSSSKKLECRMQKFPMQNVSLHGKTFLKVNAGNGEMTR